MAFAGDGSTGSPFRAQSWERRNEGFERPDSRYRGRDGESGETNRRVAAPQQTQCRFCRRGEKYVDYKDIETLAKLLTHRGKIYSRKRSGNCAGCQRKVKSAIKYARFMALLPYCT